MGHRSWGRDRTVAAVGVAALVAVITLLVGAAPAEAASPPRLTGGKQVAPAGTAATPSASSNGQQTLVVWSEKVGGTFGIYGRLTSSDTTSIGSRFTINRNPGQGAVLPDVVWNGFRWLVVWQFNYSSTDRDIGGAFVERSGAVGAAFGIETSGTDQRDPAVAADDSGNVIVVFESGLATDATSTDIWTRTVASNGTLPASSTRSSYDNTTTPTADANPDVALLGDGGFLTVWDARTSTTSEIRSRWTSLTYDFYETMSSRPLAESLAAPAVAASGRTWVVAFEAHGGGSTGIDIAAIVKTDDNRYSTWFSSSQGDERQPAVAFNDRYLATWRDRREDPTGDIYAARLDVGRDYTQLDPWGVRLVGTAAAEGRPAVTAIPTANETFGLAWEATPSGSGSGIRTAGVAAAPK